MREVGADLAGSKERFLCRGLGTLHREPIGSAAGSPWVTFVAE